MKIVSSYSAMFCFMFMIVAFFTTTCKSCDFDDKLGPVDCPVYKRIHLIYKKLESIMTNDTESLYQMRQAFFPASVAHFLETERVNVVKIRVCWVPNKTRPPPACNSLDSNNQTAKTETRCWNFRWSSLPVLNMIAVDQLLAFDPMLTSTVYSRLVDHTYRRKFLLTFDISSDVFPCTPSEDDLTQATVLLLTWSKAYAKVQGVPTTWSQEDQGYIARWYRYFSAEPYFKSKEIGENIQKVLFAIFILLSLFILHTTVTYGTKWYCRFYEILKFNDRSQKASSIYLAVGTTVTIFNLLYLTATVGACLVKHSVPPIYISECTAISHWGYSPSHDSSLYKDVLAAFITKMSVTFIAIIIDLLVAFKAVMKIPFFTASWWHTSKYSRVVQTILLGNTFVFVQIWVGLICLPACMLLLITPLQTLSVLCATLLAVAFVTAFIVYLLQFRKMCNVRACNFGRECSYFSWNFILVAITVVLVSAITILYFELLPQGVHLSTRGVIFSLIPPIALSMTSWVVKRKFLSKNSTKRKPEKQLSISSMSTEEEDLQDPDTEQDTRLDDLV